MKEPRPEAQLHRCPGATGQGPLSKETSDLGSKEWVASSSSPRPADAAPPGGHVTLPWWGQDPVLWPRVWERQVLQRAEGEWDPLTYM